MIKELYMIIDAYNGNKFSSLPKTSKRLIILFKLRWKYSLNSLSRIALGCFLYIAGIIYQCKSTGLSPFSREIISWTCLLES